MGEEFWLCVLIIMVVLLVAFSWLENFNTVEVKSSLDGNEYNVQEDLHCPKCAADLLAKVNQNTKRLIKLLDPKDPRTQRIKNRYNPENVFEGRPNGGSDTSYSLNKGQKIVYCLRSARNADKLHDLNLVQYVAIHELGHLASTGWGHGPEFRTNFSWLLREANKHGIWRYENYRRYPKEYCGIMINSVHPF